MPNVPDSIAEFLRGHRIAVAGVSRDPKQTANLIFRKFKDAGYDVVPVNPKTNTAEGVTCYPDLASIPGQIDGVFAVTPPVTGGELIAQCAARGVPRIWFHSSVFGQGSVPHDAVKEATRLGVKCIEGACPMMFVAPVDVGHRCFRWWLGVRHKLPA
ncbi:MAG: CoA-binding protein [Acidobacteriota bacterium]